MIRVLICDDQTVVREGLAAILSTDDEIEVVGLACNGEEALALAATDRPDVVLMDLNMPVMNGIQATQRLRRRHPDVRVLVLTTYADEAWVIDAIRAGAAGYLLKDTRRDDLVAAIKGTAEGKSFLDPAVAGKLMRQMAAEPAARPVDTGQVEPLTERELEVLAAAGAGLQQPGDRAEAAPGSGHCAQLREHDPAEAGCRGPHPGSRGGTPTRLDQPFGFEDRVRL